MTLGGGCGACGSGGCDKPEGEAGAAPGCAIKVASGVGGDGVGGGT